MFEWRRFCLQIFVYKLENYVCECVAAGGNAVLCRVEWNGKDVLFSVRKDYDLRGFPLDIRYG